MSSIFANKFKKEQLMYLYQIVCLERQRLIIFLNNICI